MDNISLNGEVIKTKIGTSYLIIDALYLNDVKENIPNFCNDIISEIRLNVFPYTDTPFAEYIAIDSTFDIHKIKKVDNMSKVDASFFSTDTGLLVLINKNLLVDLLNSYDYDKLVDSPDPNEIINLIYWEQLKSNYDTDEVGLILAPGIDSGFDFEGSGTYRIV